MDDMWFTVGVPATVAVATAVYTTGGRAALARRAIKQDLEIAATLNHGPARQAVERMAEEKAVLYASRWIGPQVPGLRQHAILGSITVGGIGLTAAAVDVGDAGAAGTFLSAIVLLMLLVGLSATLAGAIAWGVLTLSADNARTRAETVSAGRTRLQHHLAEPDDAHGPASLAQSGAQAEDAGPETKGAGRRAVNKRRGPG